MDPPSCLKHHAKSQATGQKTQLFSAVTLLNLIFPASSPRLCLRAKCIFGLCHTTRYYMPPRPSHSAEAICKWAATLPQSGDFRSEFLEERPEPRSLYSDRQSRDNRATPPRLTSALLNTKTREFRINTGAGCGTRGSRDPIFKWCMCVNVCV